MNTKDFFEKHIPQDGWMFQTGFEGETQEESFYKLKEFFQNEGLSHIPLPDNARRLWWDYLKPNSDGDIGSFIWHPIIINQSHYRPNLLELCVYDERHPEHFKLWENIV